MLLFSWAKNWDINNWSGQLACRPSHWRARKAIFLRSHPSFHYLFQLRLHSAGVTGMTAQLDSYFCRWLLTHSECYSSLFQTTRLKVSLCFLSGCIITALCWKKSVMITHRLCPGSPFSKELCGWFFPNGKKFTIQKKEGNTSRSFSLCCIFPEKSQEKIQEELHYVSVC